tara:strand:- start:420 stop:674 length:255 start_codon:yes stop_codon:yes gene_type:complete
MKKFLELVEKKIKDSIVLENIRIIDNTHKHKKHKSLQEGQSHLSIEIESKFLKSINRLKAQRIVMKILHEEMKSKIHALEIKII